MADGLHAACADDLSLMFPAVLAPLARPAEPAAAPVAEPGTCSVMGGNGGATAGGGMAGGGIAGLGASCGDAPTSVVRASLEEAAIEAAAKDERAEVRLGEGRSASCSAVSGGSLTLEPKGRRVGDADSARLGAASAA